MTNSLKLEKPYIIKKIEPSAFKTVLGSTYQTAYRLYLITNGIKEIQNFFECTHEDYFVTAIVKTEAAVAGEAKRQVWAVKHLQPLLYKKPRYSVRCSVTDKKTNKSIYKCELTSSNQNVIYEQVLECIEDLNQIL